MEEPERYLLTYDIITSTVKASIFTENGHLVRSAFRSLPIIFAGHWAHQDPQSWWDGVVTTTREVLEGLDTSRVAAMSFTDQVQVCLCVDASGRPLTHAITWSDTRSLELDEDAIGSALSPEEYYSIAGQPNTPCSSIRKLVWVKEKWPNIYASTHKMLGCKDYIVLRLTGNYITDYSDAGSTGAFDVNSMTWSRKILDAAGIDDSKLPTALPSTQIVGEVSPEAARLTGLHPGTPVVNGAGDFTCSAMGAGAVHEGDVFLNLGSSSWIAMASADLLTGHGMGIVNCVHAVSGLYVALANMQEIGVTFKWLKNLLRYDGPPVDSTAPVEPYRNVYPYDGMGKMVLGSPQGAKGLRYVPYILGASVTNPDHMARAAFTGINVEHTAQDFVRAALEGVSAEMARVLKEFRRHYSISKVVATGVACHEAEWIKILADAFEAEVVPADSTTTVDSLGAARIAMARF